MFPNPQTDELPNPQTDPIHQARYERQIHRLVSEDDMITSALANFRTFLYDRMRTVNSFRMDQYLQTRPAKHWSYTVADVGAGGQPLVYVSDGFEKLTGYKYAAVVGKNCKYVCVRSESAGAGGPEEPAVPRSSGATHTRFALLRFAAALSARHSLPLFVAALFAAALFAPLSLPPGRVTVSSPLSLSSSSPTHTL